MNGVFYLVHCTESIVGDARSVSSLMTKLPKWLKVTLGIFLILFGTIGHLIPLLPGTWFIAAGLLLVAEVIPAVHRRIEKLELRYPKLSHVLARVKRPDGSLNLSIIAVLLLIVSLLYMIVAYVVLRVIVW